MLRAAEHDAVTGRQYSRSPEMLLDPIDQGRHHLMHRPFAAYSRSRDLGAILVAGSETRRRSDAFNFALDETITSIAARAVNSELNTRRARVENEQDALTGVNGTHHG